MNKKPTRPPRNASPARRSKYGNTRINAFGKNWASKWELQVWLDLKAMEDQGLIHGLKTQVPISYKIGDEVVWKNILDFEFYINMDGKKVVYHADAKSYHSYNTRTWKTSEKFYRATYGKDILVFLNKKSTDVKKSIYNLIY